MSADLEEFDVDQMLADQAAGRQQDQEQDLLQGPMKAQPKTSPVGMWMANLPRNISIGVMDAALATSETLVDMADNLSMDAATNKILQNSVTAAERRSDPEMSARLSKLSTEPEHPWIEAGQKAVRDFRDHLAQGSNTADSITQGVAQFAVPFLGWSKLLGVAKAPGLLAKIGRGLIAESATAATALDPQAGRLADLIALGRHAEGKLGSALRTAVPDGSLLNRYIDYMTDRSDESNAEGRFKNVLDNLPFSLAVTGLFLTGAKAFKSVRSSLASPAPVAPATPVSAGKPFEIEAFRGVPSGVDPLDSSSSYGNALFFSPHESVAQAYAEGGGVVSKHKLKFNNMLEANNLVDARTKLGLGPDAELDEIVKAARKAGHDGFTFDNGTGRIGREYVSIPPLPEQ